MSSALTILVMEDSDALRTRIETILGKSGYRVDAFASPEDGLAAISKKRPPPYALMISGYAVPGMNGDEILARASELSPDTQRILMADAAYIDTMIKAVNTARLHSCLTVPFDDQDLVRRVENACRQFQSVLKQRHLIRITRRQNLKLFRLATRHKEEGTKNAALLKGRETRCRVLGAKLSALQARCSGESVPDMGALLETMGVDMIPDRFETEFLKIREQVRQILETAASGKDIHLRAIPYGQIRAGLTDKDGKYPIVPARLHSALRTLLLQSWQAGMDLFGEGFDRFATHQFRLTFSPDRSRAGIRMLQPAARSISPLVVRMFLAGRGVCHGIVSDAAIQKWLSHASPSSPEFTIARGREPVRPTHGDIRYHFPRDYRQPGKVDGDGRIDFTERGEIPHVETDALLATRILPKHGKSGRDVFGREIAVEQTKRHPFEAGPGARLSTCKTRIYAERDGQPLVDPLGSVCVCAELEIRGDLGFETGDVVFDGHVRVYGRVKEGFRIRATSLTAEEVQGADIDLDGDLNVSLGIVDTEMIDVRGTVRAKFVRNSRINALGDLVVQREIVDSHIRISGTLINPHGTTIASRVSANRGVDAGHIGTDHAAPADITVGVDDYAKSLENRVKRELTGNQDRIRGLEKRIEALRQEEFHLHTHIAGRAHVQERAEQGLSRAKARMSDVKAAGNMAAYQRLDRSLPKLAADAQKAEAEIEAAFQRQDEIAVEINALREGIGSFRSGNQDLERRLAQIRATREKIEPRPEIWVGGSVRSGTRISGPHAGLTLRASREYCLIREFASKAGAKTVYAIEIASNRP